MITDSIQKTKQGFEESFKEGTLYNKQTQDDKHLNMILDFMNIKKQSNILDLGTGSGYLAFAIAAKYPDCNITGLDIVEQALENDRYKSKQQGINNINFVSYNGLLFPFENNSFDYVATRYCLHHFPSINDTFKEINRVLKTGGTLFISDPTPNKDDKDRFVDEYMQMKKDGHIKYYTKDEFVAIAAEAGLVFCDSFDSEITFPRLMKTANGFKDIMSRHKKCITEGYNVKITPDNEYIYITQKVLNLKFRKK